MLAGGLSAQNAPSLMIDATPESVALAKTGTDAAAKVFAGENTFVGLNAGMWAPNSADNSELGVKAHHIFGGKLLVGLQYQNFSDKVPTVLMTEDGIPGKEFTPSEYVFGLDAAYRINESLSVGVSGKYFNTTVAGADGNGNSGNSIAADLSVAYRSGSLGAALAVRNLGPGYNLGGSGYAIPSMVALSGDYTVGSLKANAEVDYLFSGALMAGVGVEYGFMDMIFVRGGFHYGDKAKALPSYAALGLGLELPFGLGCGVSYLIGSETLGNTLLAGLSFAF